MKISEMTLEQLQDYAVELENKVQAKEEELQASATKQAELQDLNTTLQKRNHALFLQVEQQPERQEGADKLADPEPLKSCEDLGKELKGVIR